MNERDTVWIHLGHTLDRNLDRNHALGVGPVGCHLQPNLAVESSHA